MKKIVLGCLCLIVMAMSCEIPQSLTIKGSPSLYIPLGSPLSEENKIGIFLSPAKIKEMMGEGGETKINIIDYWIPGSELEPAQAYIVHYPIMEEEFNFSEYMGEAAFNMEFPLDFDDFYFPPAVDFPDGGFFLTETSREEAHNDETPSLIMDLPGSFNLVTEVSGGKGAFGIEIDYEQEFEENLMFYIPAFGVGAADNYQKGELNGGKLKFVNNSANHTFYPQKDGKVKVYIQVKEPCSGTIEFGTVFNWDTAKIKPDEDLSDTFEIKIDLEDFMGEGVSFKDVKGYIYVGGVGDHAALSLTAENGFVLVNGEDELTNRTRPSFLTGTGTFNQQLPKHSLEDYIDFTAIINTQGASLINYNLKINERTIRNGEEDDALIYADLIIVLSMEFKVEGSSSMPGYVKLDLGLGDLFSGMGNGDDWFGRTNEGEDSLLSNIDSVKIILKNLRNDIFYDNNFHILFINFDQNGGSDFSSMIGFKDKPEPSMTLVMDEIPVPFSPRIEMLLLADSGSPAATLKIKRQDFARNLDPVFDFFLTIEADTSLNHTITF